LRLRPGIACLQAERLDSFFREELPLTISLDNLVINTLQNLSRTTYRHAGPNDQIMKNTRRTLMSPFCSQKDLCSSSIDERHDLAATLAATASAAMILSILSLYSQSDNWWMIAHFQRKTIRIICIMQPSCNLALV
jgi:hypothetical protein